MARRLLDHVNMRFITREFPPPGLYPTAALREFMTP
jgi:hypothetical protein